MEAKVRQNDGLVEVILARFSSVSGANNTHYSVFNRREKGL
jgi:hypothetical protein